MKNNFTINIIFCLFLLALTTISKAEGQITTPDARNISPAVMLLLDSSGSMERVNNCICTTSNCTECLPTCSNTNNGVNQQNRWSVIVQALGGDYSPFKCLQTTRPFSTPDFGYNIPFYSFTGTQSVTNGILDTYGIRVRFGLMTFDNIETVAAASSLYTSTNYLANNTTTNWQGDFSYGPNRIFSLPGIMFTYMINNGARSENALNPTYGRLFSIGSSSTTSQSRAALVKAELPLVRPYGGRPIAAMLHDYEYYLNNHTDVVNDPYNDCRQQIAILIVSGYPNSDMRGSPYFCENTSSGGVCPYDEPEMIAARINVSNRKVYVIGLGNEVVSDPTLVSKINLIARFGGTNNAFFANNASTLRTQIAYILDTTATGTTSRSIPTISSTATLTNNNSPVQSQYNSGFTLGTNGGPYNGILERHRTQCVNTMPIAQTIDNNDRFHMILNQRISTRTLYTVVPRSATNTTGYLVGVGNGVPPLSSASGNNNNNNNNNSNQAHGNGGSSCRTPGNNTQNNSSSVGSTASESGLALTEFNSNNVTAAHLGLTSGSTSARNAERDRIVNWIHGANNSRGTLISRLGDIYHSSPIIVGRPQFSIPDESYNQFKQLPVVANRPSVLYVASNDGVLHAFIAETITVTAGPYAGRTFTAGEELWGFIPPYVLPKLQSATSVHTWTVDGTPYVREVFYRRLPGQTADASIYHTVLIIPLGKGGGAYIALDVTNPLVPIFLWQFTSSNMGITLGAPAIAQVLISVNGNLEERAMAILPSGYKEPIDPNTCGPTINGDSWSQPLGCSSNGIGTPPLNAGTQNAVNHHRCWNVDGRQVYFVDPSTGQLIKSIGDTVFNAPMTGGIGLYSGDIGTITTRAFMTDADGFLWRFDLSSSNPSNWSALQFADLYVDLHSLYPNVGQPSHFAPVISTNAAGELVVIQGTGNIDYLDGTAPNRIVSFTETMNGNTVGIRTNWTVALPSGEQMTGPIQLYDSTVYFTTFSSIRTSTNACQLGTSYIWGVDFIEASGSSPMARLQTSASTYVQKVSAGNNVLLGAALAQELSCVTTSPIVTYDPYVQGNISGYDITGSGGGGYRMFGLVGGISSSAITNGSSIGEFNRTLESPSNYTRIDGYVGRAE